MDIGLNMEHLAQKKTDKIDGYSEKLSLLCTIKPIY